MFPKKSLRFVLLGVAPLFAQAQETPPAKEDPLRYGAEVPAGAVAVLDERTVSPTLYFEELVSQQLRGGRAGGSAVDSLIEEILIAEGLDARNLEVPGDAVAQKMEQIRAQLKEQNSGASLEELVARENIPMAVFRRKLERVVALEALARKDLPVPEGKPVENWHLKAWLTQAKENAEIERAPEADLPRGVVARVDGETISATQLGRELLLVTSTESLVRTVNVLLEEILLDQILDEHDLMIKKTDLTHEWEYRKRIFKKTPKFKGLAYEDVLTQKTGLSSEAWRASREFRIAAGRGLLARELFGPEEIQEGFERHRNLYGPVYHLRHILVRASDNDELTQRGNVRSKAKGRERIQLIAGQLEKGISFADAARQHSEDRGSQFRGGELPPLTPGRNPFEPELLEHVEEMEPGEISDPLWTRIGWHLVKLDKKEPVPEIDEDIEADLRRVLVRELLEERMRAAEAGWDLHRLMPDQQKTSPDEGDSSSKSDQG